MQIRLTLEPRQPFAIPLSYHYQIQSAIYHLLNVNPDYAHFLHDTGYGSTSSRFRLFTFGGLSGKCRIVGKEMQIEGRITLEIRSISEEFCKILKQALLEREEFRLFDQTLSVRMIEVGEKHVTAERVSIVTRSPIVVKCSDEAGKTIYYAPHDAEFLPLLQNNYIRKYAACFGTEPEGGILLLPQNQPRKVVTRCKGIWVTAYHGKFLLIGKPESLDLLDQTGLGSKNAQGFGMFDLIDE